MALDLTSIGKKIGPLDLSYTWKDVILYSLGVGAGFDDLEYCYEAKLKVIPTFAVSNIMTFFNRMVRYSEINPAGLLHGEQDLVIHSPMSPQGDTLTTGGKITNIYDKGAGRGAVVLGEAETYGASGVKLFTNTISLFARLDGGFGGVNAPVEKIEFPDRSPDFEEAAVTYENQPLLYRLSGDLFAVHVDPEVAKASGFEKPIMHGLCTFGYACRGLVKHLMPGEPERMRRIRVRFSRVLYPGEPIKTQIWQTDEGSALFRTLNARTGDVVLDRGVVEWQITG